MSRPFVPATEGWGRVSLAELNQRAPLLDRAESKYLAGSAFIEEVMDELRPAFDVLAIDGQTVFTYDTVYYDTDCLRAYRDQVQGRRRRLKVRSRHYVESDLYFFEVKLKGPRGRTIKERMPYDGGRHGAVGPDALGFVQDCVLQNYGESFAHRLEPQLTMRYRRLTLVGKGAPERVTIDFDLDFVDAGPEGARAQAPPGTLIVEVKSADGRGVADQVLRAAGARGGSCSKYCIGLNLVRPGLRYNRFKPLLEHHFQWTPGFAL
jgi:hypothetical protein